MNADDLYKVGRLRHPDGSQSHWVFGPGSEPHLEAREVLGQYSHGTQQTYAYYLADHLNWASANGKTAETTTISDLHRYIAAIQGKQVGIIGVPWRGDKSPISASAAANTATIVRRYYIHALTKSHQNEQLLRDLNTFQPSTRTRKGIFTSNPLSPKVRRPHPRSVSTDQITALFAPEVLRTTRDLMIIVWLADSGIRVGGLCGLRFQDLHLVRNHPCGQKSDPHIHIMQRDDNPNKARAKITRGQQGIADDSETVTGGVIRSASPAMISTYFAYLLDEYLPIQHDVKHQNLLVHVHGRTKGAALTTSGVRSMIRRAGKRANIPDRITPHMFRHRAASLLYAESNFNAEKVAQEFGWRDPTMVTEVYGQSANSDTRNHLEKTWLNLEDP